MKLQAFAPKLMSYDTNELNPTGASVNKRPEKVLEKPEQQHYDIHFQPTKEYTGFEVNGFDEDGSSFVTHFGDRNSRGGFTDNQVHNFAERLGEYFMSQNAIGNMFRIHGQTTHPVFVP